MSDCPVCSELLKREPDEKIFWPNTAYDCPRCGQFVFRPDLSNGIGDYYSEPHRRSILSHRLRCMFQPERKSVFVGWNDLISWHLDDPLPSPAEQADRLILWIGDHQPSPGEYAICSTSATSAWVGAKVTSPQLRVGIEWLLTQPQMKALFDYDGFRNENFLARLTIAGWQRYEAIKRATVESRTAFMAMKFGDPELTAIVEDHFRPAVQLAGFQLRLLSDGQPAGLIDDQMRVRLRTSRFTIADLTHANNGAYWEAGFAEGLGRPVIYTCRKKEWDELDANGKRKVHFDTNHLATVIWDPTNPADAAQKLTAMIRATLPGEAKMTD